MSRQRRYTGYIVLLNGKPIVRGSLEPRRAVMLPNLPGLTDEDRFLWTVGGVSPVGRRGRMAPRVSVFPSRAACNRAINASITLRQAGGYRPGSVVDDYTIVAIDGAP